MNSQEDSLNKSKFMQEQVNFDEQPSEEEVIQRAEELGIKDLGLAKQSLVKELQPQWKPYMNRSGQIFYINLQERKAYHDHPIDMQFKITYALRNKLKIPNFKQYQIQQISRSLDLVQQQIKRYQNNQSLNIVYEQSQQESVRKNTDLNNSQQEDIIQADLQEFIEASNDQLERYRLDMQQQRKTQLDQYRKAKESQYVIRSKKHQSNIQEIKSSRIKQLAEQLETEWVARNHSNYQKAIEALRQQLETKKQKYEDLLQKQINTLYTIHHLKLSQKNLKVTNRQKIIRQKMALQNELEHNCNLSLRQKVNKQLSLAIDKYFIATKQLVRNRINYKDSIDRNIQQICKITSNQLTKKRLPIFKSQLHQAAQISQNDEQRLFQQLKVDQLVWTKKEEFKNQYCPQIKGSLSLRLMKRIL